MIAADVQGVQIGGAAVYRYAQKKKPCVQVSLKDTGSISVAPCKYALCIASLLPQIISATSLNTSIRDIGRPLMTAQHFRRACAIRVRHP